MTMNFLSIGFGVMLILSISNAALANNIIPNGDFSSANTGFTSQYGGTPSTGNYFTAQQSPYGPLVDHTTGTGLFFVGDGDSLGANAYQVTLSVNANTSYNFSFFYGNADSDNVNNAILATTFNGISAGPSVVTGNPGVWSKAAYTFMSGSATSLTIGISDKQGQYYFNDFGLDDVSLVSAGGGVSPVPLPASAPLFGAGLIVLGAAGYAAQRKKAAAAAEA